MKWNKASCRLAFPCLFFTLLSFFNAEALELKEEHLIEDSYEEIRLLAYQLVSEFSPSRYLYVGVGRSPTPLIAFLQAIDRKVAINFPLSDFHYSGKHMMDEENLKILHRHFEEFFGHYRKKGKVIVFIDYVISGETLFNVQKYYQNFREKDKAYPRSLSVGLSYTGADISPLFVNSHFSTPRVLHMGDNLETSMRIGMWKDMAEYEKTDLTTLRNHPPLKTSPHTYEALKTRFMAKQKEDASSEFFKILQKFSLNGHIGNCLRFMKSLLFLSHR